MPASMPSQTPYDITLFGATSFVGQLVAAYLVKVTNEQQRPLRWALAGRSQSKLEALRQSLGEEGAQLPIVLADVNNEAELRDLCAHTRVVISTVGPYALYGEPLVRACAESGTDYCDLTGEAQWIRRMLERYEDKAKESGARIVHCCGFDSIPSDMGMRFLQQQSLKQWGEPAVEVEMRVHSLKGGASGGTVASIVNVVREAASDKAARRALLDPFSLCPQGHGFTAKQPRVKAASWDEHFKAWAAPFIMGAINEAVVRRSHALMPEWYRPEFRYHEALLTGRGFKGRLKANGVVVGLAAFMAGVGLPPTRYLLERFVLPQPGEGPDAEQQAAGGYDLRFYGRTQSGKELRVRVTGEGDPGYASTSRILSQAALCLAEDELDTTGGFWTPASLLGEALQQRLERQAGLSFEQQT